MQILPVKAEKLGQIAFLENAIEGVDAASLKTLSSRLHMFPEGFRAACEGDKIVGYIESCLWNVDPPKFEPQVDFFFQHHNSQGRILYIIFVGVTQEYRRKGIGSMLIKSLLNIAEEFGAHKIHAVCREDLRPFYDSMGFVARQRLPGFLPVGTFTLMEMECPQRAITNAPG